MKIISSAYLQINLKILSILFFLLSVLIIISPYNLVLFGIFFLVPFLSFFSLSIGVMRKEKWAAVCGLIYCGLLLGIILRLAVDTNVLLPFFVGLFFLVFFIFISFINFLKKEELKKEMSFFPFMTILLSIIVSLSVVIFLF